MHYGEKFKLTVAGLVHNGTTASRLLSTKTHPAVSKLWSPSSLMIITFVFSLQQNVKDVICADILCFSAFPPPFPFHIVSVFPRCYVFLVFLRTDVLVKHHKYFIKGNMYEHRLPVYNKERYIGSNEIISKCTMAPRTTARRKSWIKH